MAAGMKAGRAAGGRYGIVAGDGGDQGRPTAGRRYGTVAGITA
jgi:hypothetical protein